MFLSLCIFQSPAFKGISSNFSQQHLPACRNASDPEICSKNAVRSCSSPANPSRDPCGFNAAVKLLPLTLCSGFHVSLEDQKIPHLSRRIKNKTHGNTQISALSTKMCWSKPGEKRLQIAPIMKGFWILPSSLAPLHAPASRRIKETFSQKNLTKKNDFPTAFERMLIPSRRFW